MTAGHKGLVIVDVENPTELFVDQTFNANGKTCDLQDVKLGITNASAFAYLADGEHGMHVLQLTSADTPGTSGFSPRPYPRLISTRKLAKGEALAISEGLDRDRAVDRSGNQIAVLGRVGARPSDLKEQQELYLRDGEMWRISDDPEFYRQSPQLPGAIKGFSGPEFSR